MPRHACGNVTVKPRAKHPPNFTVGYADCDFLSAVQLDIVIARVAAVVDVVIIAGVVVVVVVVIVVIVIASGVVDGINWNLSGRKMRCGIEREIQASTVSVKYPVW